MSNKVLCPICGQEVEPMAVGNKKFCPSCEADITDVQPAAPEKPSAQPVETAPAESPAGGHVIKDGMGMIEENRTKIGAVETFSDNSVTNHTTNTTTNTTNISNITKIEDDTKKSVICEISGRKVLVTSSVVCPICGKTVAEQYYDEEKLRCTVCEKKAVEAYEKFYKEMTAGSRVIDKELRSVLDAKARSFKLTEEQVKESELKLRKTQTDKQDRLSDIQQKDFDRTIKQLKEGKIAAAPCMSKISAYAKLTDDAAVQCWYWLLSAVVSPENYLKDMKAATIDNYWQSYWGFVAAMQTKNTTEAVLCVDNAKTKYPDSINDVTLAQAYLEVFQYVATKDTAYLDDADNDISCVVETESRCLQEFRERLKEVLASRTSIPSVEKMLLSRPVDAPAPQAVPQKQSAPQKPVSQTSPVKPAPAAPQKPAAQESKGYTLNTAGGPLNPTVTSFTQAPQPKKKSKAGLWVVLAIVVAVGAFLFVGGGSEEDGAQTPAVQTAETQTKTVETPAPVKEEAPVTKPAEPAAEPVAEPVAEPAPTPAPAAEPVKEAPKQTMAQKAVSAAAQAPASGPQADVLTQGLEAYKNGNYKEAHDLFKRAATAGNPEACYQLGLMLSTGKGTIAKNPLQGKVWIKKAAGLGHEEAKKALETL